MHTATIRPTIIETVRRSILALFDTPEHIVKRNAFRRAWAREQAEALQARSSDLCVSCNHERSCVACPMFDMAMRAASPRRTSASILDMSALALDFAYGAGDHQNKEAVAMAARGKEAPSTNFAARDGASDSRGSGVATDATPATARICLTCGQPNCPAENSSSHQA